MQFLEKISDWFKYSLLKKEDIVHVNQPELNCSDNKAWQMYVMNELGSPYVADKNYLTLFHSVAEVFFPINFIARRVAGAHFDIKKYSDDSVVYCSERAPKSKRLNAILQAPNCIQRWRELVYMHMVYKLASGNGFIRAAMPDAFADKPKWDYCNHFWSIPSTWIKVAPASTRIPMFGMASLEELVGNYEMTISGNTPVKIPTYQIWHDRDGMAEFANTYSGNFLKSKSRLQSVHPAISNLIAVYESRNVIYVKRGALGYLVAKKDGGELGTQAMKPEEKKELVKDLNGQYGLEIGKDPIGITDVPLEFIKVNASIQELQPFDETLQDAITIAGAFEIPAVLVPRKDQSTFSNQATAEKGVYTGTIIPLTKQFCEDLTLFLGLDMDGYYIDADFSDVDCLQIGLKDSEEVKKLINDRCRNQFNDGLISYNTWRAQIYESALPGEIFNKTKFEMTPEELARIDTIIKSNNSKTSTGESNDRNIEKNPVSD